MPRTLLVTFTSQSANIIIENGDGSHKKPPPFSYGFKLNVFMSHVGNNPLQHACPSP